MPHLPTSKTLAHGLAKTRSGSMPIDVMSLIERSKLKGFADRIKKAVSEDEALDAARLLSQKGRVRRYTEGAIIGGSSYPILNAAGETVHGFTSHSGSGKIRAAGAALKGALRKPEIAKSVTRGALGGGVIQGVREGVELGKAKKTVKTFVNERGG